MLRSILSFVLWKLASARDPASTQQKKLDHLFGGLQSYEALPGNDTSLPPFRPGEGLL